MTTGPSDTSDAGDWLVGQVAARVGALSADEQAAVYGAGYSYASSSTVPIHPDTAAWVATLLQDFRAHPCPYCRHGLLEHTLSVMDVGPVVICDADGVSRAAWDWHSGPPKQPAWRVLLAVALWVGIPLVTIGLAGWLMPLVGAVLYRRRPWIMATAVWGAMTVGAFVTVDSESDNPLLGLFALVMWFGSALYGGLQVKPWLACLGAPRR